MFKSMLLVLLLCSLCHAQNTQEEILKRVDNIGTHLEVAAQKLGVAAEQVWGIVMRQQFQEGVLGLSLFALSFSIMLIGLIKLTKLLKIADWENKITIECGIFACGILLIIMCVLGGLLLTPTITKITNPEYHAIQVIRDLVRQ